MMKGHYREVVGCSRKSPSTRFLPLGREKAQIDSQSVALTFGLAGKLEGTFLPERVCCYPLAPVVRHGCACPTNVGLSLSIR